MRSWLDALITTRPRLNWKPKHHLFGAKLTGSDQRPRRCARRLRSEAGSRNRNFSEGEALSYEQCRNSLL